MVELKTFKLANWKGKYIIIKFKKCLLQQKQENRIKIDELF